MINAKRILAAVLAAATVFTFAPYQSVTANAAKTKVSSYKKIDTRVNNKIPHPTGLDASTPEKDDSGKRFATTDVNGDPSKYAQYTNCWYYDQMNSSQKALYDTLSRVAAGVMDNSDRNFEYISADYTGIVADDAYLLAYVWEKTNPQYFFLSTKMSYSDSYVKIYLYDDYQDGAKRAEAKNQFFSNLDEIVRQGKKGKTDLEKESIVHDLLAKKLRFNGTGAGGEDIGARKQSADTAIITSDTVCAGYSEGFAVVMNALGVPTLVVTSEPHAWNEIRIDGRWYNVDLLWDDGALTKRSDGAYDNDYPDGRNITHIWYNISDSTMTMYDSSADHQIQDYWNRFGRPQCLNDLYSNDYDDDDDYDYDDDDDDEDYVIPSNDGSGSGSSSGNSGSGSTAIGSDTIDGGSLSGDFSDLLDGEQKKSKEYPGKTITTLINGTSVSTYSDQAGHTVSMYSITYSNGSTARWAVTDVYAEEDDETWLDLKLDRAIKDIATHMAGGNTKYYLCVNVATQYTNFNIYIYDVNSSGQLFYKYDDHIDQYCLSFMNWDMFSDSMEFTSSNPAYYVFSDDEAASTTASIESEVYATKKSVTMKKGKSRTLDIETNESVRNVKWSSSKSSVAKVSKNGKIKARKKGTAYARANVEFMNGDTKTIKIKVKVK